MLPGPLFPGMIKKEGKWLPYQLKEQDIENRFNACVSLLTRYSKKDFLYQIVTGDEKWIDFDSAKRQKVWTAPGQPLTSRNMHAKRAKLCIWSDQHGIIHYELLKHGVTVDGSRYQQQLVDLNRDLNQIQPFVADKRRTAIFHYDNARSHASKSVKETLLSLGWEVPLHPAYSPDIAPSDCYHDAKYIG